MTKQHNRHRLLIALLLTVALSLAAWTLPASASSIPDDLLISDDIILVTIDQPDPHPAEEEICTLIGAAIQRVRFIKNQEVRLITYALNTPGRDAAVAAIDLINETYKQSETEILAEPNILAEIDDPVPMTVSDVVNLRQLVLSAQTPTQDELEKFDLSGDRTLTVEDVVLLRIKIKMG